MAGARIRHLGEDGLTGESIIRSQDLRPDIRPGSPRSKKITGTPAGFAKT